MEVVEVLSSQGIARAEMLHLLPPRETEYFETMARDAQSDRVEGAGGNAEPQPVQEATASVVQASAMQQIEELHSERRERRLLSSRGASSLRTCGCMRATWTWKHRAAS